MVHSAKDLLRIGLFDGLNGDHRLQLYEVSKQRQLGHNVEVLREGDKGDSFFAIIKGSVRVTKIIDGTERTLAHLSNGEVFGEMALVEGYPRFATVTTLEPTDLLEFKKEDLDKIFEKFPTIAKQVYWNLSKGLSSKLRYFGENVKEITIDWV